MPPADPAEESTRESRTSLHRLLPRLRAVFEKDTAGADWHAFETRLSTHFHRLFRVFHKIYGDRYDFFFHLEAVLTTAATMWLRRPAELKGLDAIREGDPLWYQSNRMIGCVAYVDLFAGDLDAVRDRIPYLQEMGISYLHLMPLFKSPPGDNDGGYAISSYREVEPELGTTEDLIDLAAELRGHGVSLTLDFVFNHTSDEHAWAKAALAGDEEHQEFYRMYQSRDMPDQYERTIRSIFPDAHPGCFTYRSQLRRWVWTTFNNYQWDLNYENPAVFNAMAEEMLFLANAGVEILRMDAVPFLWKRLGTSCENLPEAHLLIQAFNAVVRIAAPAMVFKSEAIVAPDDIAKYISDEECHLSYNPLLMALLWDSLATRNAKMLRYSMERRFAISENCAWVNYVRGHDDIGWGFADDDALALDIHPFDHRRFLNDFFTGRHPSSFATGLPFQENLQTGDARVCGTTASLCGLERALELDDAHEIEMAIRRILLIYGVVFTIGGIPLLYLGDEIGTLNDYNYSSDPEKDGDDRWLHRPAFDWEKAENRRDSESVEGKIFRGILQLVQIRRNNFAFSRSSTEIVDTGNDQVFGYFRTHVEQSVLCLASFSETPQEIPAVRLRQLGLRKTFTDIVAGRSIIATQKLTLEPLQFMVLVGAIA
ncbi:alpha-amylase family glycosyl hydrolase [soil metagenome]